MLILLLQALLVVGFLVLGGARVGGHYCFSWHVAQQAAVRVDWLWLLAGRQLLSGTASLLGNEFWTSIY